MSLQQSLQRAGMPVCANDPDLWFSDHKTERRRAIELCHTCPLIRECREYGQTQEFGVWGGVLRTPDVNKPGYAHRQEEPVTRIKRLRERGFTESAIARELGWRVDTVEYVLHQEAA